LHLLAVSADNASDMGRQNGMFAIIELYHQKVAPPGRPGSLGRIELLGCQMIPRIIDAEFP
jgi:hypothetical protein